MVTVTVGEGVTLVLRRRIFGYYTVSIVLGIVLFIVLRYFLLCHDMWCYVMLCFAMLSAPVPLKTPGPEAHFGPQEKDDLL